MFRLMKVAITTSSFSSTSNAPLKLLERFDIELLPNPHGRRFTREEIAALLQTDIDGLLAGLEPLDTDVFNIPSN